MTDCLQTTIVGVLNIIYVTFGGMKATTWVSQTGLGAEGAAVH